MPHVYVKITREGAIEDRRIGGLPVGAYRQTVPAA